ncbi:COMM domain-containing protein 5-like isoform X2 [Homalodisca vitripennis]|nr:COMM domain-containing protein 5-like isoform X2 [Homalodisca vitripennis]XP_046669626.1 COMM domain-containing protein 5-like isoform X2 [Homalodisca vitripennis]XP_046669627.1 COMM domain-containing protein 5-like isoform X2 [Homalodisca vitripennis]
MEVTNFEEGSLKWRIDIIISSRDLSRILEPVICLEFNLDSGERQSVEMPVSKFHSLRHSIALLLKEMETVNQRLASIKSAT